MLTHREMKELSLRDPVIKAEYDRLEEEFAIFDIFLKARAAAGLTQAEVAKRMGTTQSVIARLESGKGSPSLATLRKYARALGCRLNFSLTRESTESQPTNQ